MNWKLVFQLSLFGLAMGIATIMWIPGSVEPIFWLFIFVICAFFIARNCTSKYFLNGFFVSIVNSVWITFFHVVFFIHYMASHPEMQLMNALMPLHHHPRILMIITGPVVGAVSGLVLGLFAFIASKFVKKPTTIV